MGTDGKFPVTIVVNRNVRKLIDNDETANLYYVFCSSCCTCVTYARPVLVLR